jgi:hypothetical protein
MSGRSTRGARRQRRVPAVETGDRGCRGSRRRRRRLGDRRDQRFGRERLGPRRCSPVAVAVGDLGGPGGRLRAGHREQLAHRAEGDVVRIIAVPRDERLPRVIDREVDDVPALGVLLEHAAEPQVEQHQRARPGQQQRVPACSREPHQLDSRQRDPMLE